MQLYPAIDIKQGQCVRLKQGMFKEIKVYSTSPSDMACYWERQGATYLHLVDLDGALKGSFVNEAPIREVIERVDIPIQIGGGIRCEESIRFMLDLGVSRVIIGTKAVEDPDFIRKMIHVFGPESIVVGVDAKHGMVATEGWEKISQISALELCHQMKELGVKHVVYTDISRDGMLAGPNIETTKQLTMETGMDIIASGGMSCINDLKQLYEDGIQGAIIGKALYEKKINLNEAIKQFE